MPLLDTAGKTGGVLPAQKEATELKRGKAIGSDNSCPSFTLDTLPLKSNIKSVYMPAFNPEMVNCPVAVEVMVIGPITTPVSAGVAR